MLELLQTSDGSHTVKHKALNETYHSIHGAIQESMHVYIRHGLQHLIENGKRDSIKILEVGFGTGLNSLLTALDKSASGIPIIYDAIEAFPLPKELTDKLNYPDYIEDHQATVLLKAMHEAPWNSVCQLTPDFALHKVHSEIQAAFLDVACYDLVYFDAFAPGKQPEVWILPVLSSVAGAMKNGGILVTYCASGQFKRNLKSLSIEVETLSGPPGKKEVIRATLHE